MGTCYQLILKRRTIRKFSQKKIKKVILRKVVAAARVAPSAANLQFLEYLIVDRKNLIEKIFPCTKWAGYLQGKGTPLRQERPPAYVVLLIDRRRAGVLDLRDVGAAVQNLLLSSLCFDIASCWIGSIDKQALRLLLRVPARYEIDSVIALGYPRQKSTVVVSGNKVAYWQDKKGNLTVPKRPLKDMMHFNEI